MRYNIARVPMFMQAKTFFLDSFTEYHQVVFPVGGDVLFYPSLRFNTDYGLAINAWFAYLVIVSSSYATARYFGSKPIAITAMLVIASVPLLVFQATGTKPDIWCAAVASVIILLFVRSSVKINGHELLLQILFIAFGLSLKFTFVAFAMPMVLYQCLLVIKQSRTGMLVRQVKNNWALVFCASIIALALSPVWLIIHNLFYWGHFSGPELFVASHVNPDGVAGAAANLIRYFFQAIHLLTPTDMAFEQLFQMRLTDLLDNLYKQYFQPVLGYLGIADSRLDLSLKVRARWGDGENAAWFGPLGVIIVLPAIVYSLFLRNAILAAISVCLISYVLILSWQISWMPWNGRFFSLVPAASSALIAVLLVKISKISFGLAIVRIMALVIMLYSAVFNQEKELLNARALTDMFLTGSYSSQLLGDNIWSKTEFGSQRQYYTDKYFGDLRVKEFSELILPEAKVGVLTRGSSWIYPFYAIRPDLMFIPLTLSKQTENNDGLDIDQLSYLLCINTNCDELQQSAIELWPGQSERGRPGVLFEKP